jgi:hypothetical protein
MCIVPLAAAFCLLYAAGLRTFEVSPLESVAENTANVSI